MSECNVNELMQASSPWLGMTPDQKLAVQAELLCRIFTNGAGISGFTPGSVIFAGPTGNAAEDNSNFYWNDTANLLFIGDRTVPTTDPTTLGSSLVVAANYSGGSGSKIPILGFFTTSSGNQLITGGLFQIVTSGTAASTSLVGLNASVFPGGGNTNSAVGVTFNVQNSAGTLTTGAGVSGTLSALTAGSITTGSAGSFIAQITSPATGGEIRGALFQVSGNGAITTVYGNRISITATGTITTEYALHVATATSGTITTRNGIFLNCRNAADIGFTIQQAATPTGDPFRITTSAAAILMKIDSGGQIWLNNAAVAETPTATHTVKIKDSSGTEYRLLALV